MDEPKNQIVDEEDLSKADQCSLPKDKRICLVGSVRDDEAVVRAAQSYGVPVLTSEDGSEYLPETSCVTIFILDSFQGAIFDAIHKSPHKIIGPIALRQLADEKEPLPNITRPLYNICMRGVILCFTGFRKKDDLIKMIPLIHHMGGSVRKDMTSNITHLIANCCGGEKYQYACTFRVPIMAPEWIISAWEQRDDITLRITQDSFLANHRLKPLFGARVSFVGFSPEETEHMQEVLTANGGTPVQPNDSHCTHVVMESGESYDALATQLSDNPNSNPFPFNLQKTDESANFSFDNCDMTMNFDDHDPLKPIPEEIFDNKYLPEILSVESPLKRKREDSEFNFEIIPKVEMTPIVPKKKKRRLSITPHIVDMLKTPLALFTPKRRQSIASIPHLKPVLTEELSVSPSESLGNLSINTNCCSTPIPETEFKLKKPGKKSRNKYRKKYIEYTGPNTIETNLKTKFKPQTKLNLTGLDSLILENSDERDDLHTPPAIKPTTPQTVPRIMVSNAVGYKPEGVKKVLNLSKRHSICVIETDRQDLYANASTKTRSRSSSPISQESLSREQPDAISKMQSWQLHPNHSVVDESAVAERPEIGSRVLLVKAEWFWASVQNAACVDEKEYLFDDYLESVISPARRESHVPTPNGAASGSMSGRRKRKRIHGTLSSLVRGASLSGVGGSESPGLHKRRSSISDAGLLSVSGSFLDCTASPDKSLLDEPECVSGDTPSSRKAPSARQQVFMELVQTESNYVNILHTIMTMFKNHLEDMPDEEALLNNTELKLIFGNLPPIYETHSRMLEELRWASAHWTEDTSIGNIFLNYATDLVKAYPPFVNFFETMKEALIQCDQSKPRFHAFLKVCQTRPECGRQSLQELLIRPVQRLPSISLLLSDILKHTPKVNPDHSALEKALVSIREVITNINEDKRKTEGMVVMFNIYDQIDKCPADLVSSHRNFVTKCEVQQLSEGLSGRGDTLVFFLFTDTLEVCKKPKPKKGNNLKSPNGLPPTAKSTHKLPYKHVRLIHLSTIRKVIDIKETDDLHNVFAIVCRNNLEVNRSNQELKEDLYYFTILDDEVNKMNFLRTLCRQMANSVCQADAESFLACLDGQQLNIKGSETNSGTLSKASFYKLAEKTKMKVGRAFSFNKTPLKRAVSSMMSPFGSSANLTPSSQLAQMRLASCNNINELGNAAGSPSSTETLIAPMSVQPTRKAKYSSLNIGALRRL